jgi:carbon-monoxide dehydrogenase small subunit
MSLKLDFPPVREVRITLEVNDRSFDLSVEPRAILADVLREQCGLTATHIGCEHGVCGACTVMVDGAPQRSCLQSAARFEGKHVETLEAFAEDALMAQLRQAFTAEHALQCGYCTPGMLITARDIALRLPDADEARIREELAGNLCRCTGYNGIVAAIQRVLRERAALKASHAA